MDQQLHSNSKHPNQRIQETDLPQVIGNNRLPSKAFAKYRLADKSHLTSADRINHQIQKVDLPSPNLFYLAIEKAEWLSSIGLTSIEHFMNAEIGTLVEQDHKREVRRIERDGQAIYIKRRVRASTRESLEMILRGQRAHTHTFNEFLHIQNLHAAGLPVMTVVAAGEIRRRGFPTQGFIVSEEVKGNTLDSEFTLAVANNNIEKEHALLKGFGHLLARTHKAGFYAAIRLKDVLMPNNKMIMIDRETRNPSPGFRLPLRARRSLNRSFRRIARDNPNFGAVQRDIVLNAYHSINTSSLDT